MLFTNKKFGTVYSLHLFYFNVSIFVLLYCLKLLLCCKVNFVYDERLLTRTSRSSASSRDIETRLLGDEFLVCCVTGQLLSGQSLHNATEDRLFDPSKNCLRRLVLR